MMTAVRLLVVEDEPVIAQALVDGLRGEGYAVDHTARGDEAVWLATEQAYDAIVLDVMLPGMNGFLVCRTLRERGNRTPIVMLTAKDGEYDEAEGLDTGADDYVTKPFSFVVLLARLRAAMRGGPSARQPVLEVDGLRLDPAEHRCSRDGTEIELTLVGRRGLVRGGLRGVRGLTATHAAGRAGRGRTPVQRGCTTRFSIMSAK